MCPLFSDFDMLPAAQLAVQLVVRPAEVPEALGLCAVRLCVFKICKSLMDAPQREAVNCAVGCTAGGTDLHRVRRIESWPLTVSSLYGVQADGVQATRLLAQEAVKKSTELEEG
jgi:hypothetical protein